MSKTGHKSDFKGIKIVLTANQRFVFSSDKQADYVLIVWSDNKGNLHSQVNKNTDNDDSPSTIKGLPKDGGNE